jgi:hypothetical protein
MTVINLTVHDGEWTRIAEAVLRDDVWHARISVSTCAVGAHGRDAHKRLRDAIHGAWWSLDQYVSLRVCGGPFLISSSGGLVSVENAEWGRQHTLQAAIARDALLRAAKDTP